MLQESFNRIFSYASREDRTSTVIYFLAYVAMGLATAAIGPTLPALALQTGATLGEISSLFIMRSLGFLIGSTVIGRFIDTADGHKTLAVAFFTLAGSLILIPVIPSLYALLFVILIVGAAQSTLSVGGNTMVIRLFPLKASSFMMGLHLFFGIGAFISPVIVSYAVLFSGSIITAFWMLAAFILPLGFMILRLRAPRPLLLPLNKMKNGLKQKTLPIITVFLFLYVGSEASIGGWIYTYTIQTGLGDAFAGAYITSVFWGALTAGRLLSLPFSVKADPYKILTVAISGCIAGTSVMLIFPASAAALWIGIGITGLSMSSVFPMTFGYVERYIGMNGKVTGWLFASSSLGAIIIPYFIGQVFEDWGAGSLRWILFISLLFSALLLFPLRKMKEPGTVIGAPGAVISSD